MPSKTYRTSRIHGSQLSGFGRGGLRKNERNLRVHLGAEEKRGAATLTGPSGLIKNLEAINHLISQPSGIHSTVPRPERSLPYLTPDICSQARPADGHVACNLAMIWGQRRMKTLNFVPLVQVQVFGESRQGSDLLLNPETASRYPRVPRIVLHHTSPHSELEGPDFHSLGSG